MLFCLSVFLSVCLSFTLATTVLDFWRTFEGLYGLQNLLVYKSQPPGLRDLFEGKCQLKCSLPRCWMEEKYVWLRTVWMRLKRRYWKIWSGMSGWDQLCVLESCWWLSSSSHSCTLEDPGWREQSRWVYQEILNIRIKADSDEEKKMWIWVSVLVAPIWGAPSDPHV